MGWRNIDIDWLIDARATPAQGDERKHQVPAIDEASLLGGSPPQVIDARATPAQGDERKHQVPAIDEASLLGGSPPQVEPEVDEAGPEAEASVAKLSHAGGAQRTSSLGGRLHDWLRWQSSRSRCWRR